MSRCRHWGSIKPTLAQCPLFTGISTYPRFHQDFPLSIVRLNSEGEAEIQDTTFRIAKIINFLPAKHDYLIVLLAG